MPPSRARTALLRTVSVKLAVKAVVAVATAMVAAMTVVVNEGKKVTPGLTSAH